MDAGRAHGGSAGAGSLTIADGPIHVELLPDVGARLHRLRVYGHDLLRTPVDAAEHSREPLRWGAYVMAPWCNRIAVAPTEIAGQQIAVASNFPDGSAIHGQVYAAPWQVRPDGALHIAAGDDGWPWPYECSVRVEIADAVLTIEQSLANRSRTPMPAGLGLHPWFMRPMEVSIKARRVVSSNTDPASNLVPVGGPFDLRRMGPMPDDLDAAWLPDADPAVEMEWPTLGIGAVMTARCDAGAWIVAASPRDVEAIAIEPQTHAPHGLRRLIDGEPGGLQLLDPGGTLRLTIRLAFERR